MALEARGTPLVRRPRAFTQPRGHDLLVAVEACAVCRTDLHVVDGELPDVRHPIVPGHQVVGRVIARGEAVRDIAVGARVGIAWLGSTCGVCAHCREARENLCDVARFTGYHVDGGFATHCAADARFAIPLPETVAALTTAPLLCGGLIGYRALRLAGDARRIGMFGFGSAAHVITQVAAAQGRDVFAFTRPGDMATQALAREVGASWAGGTDAAESAGLDAAIIFAADGSLVPLALAAVRKGGRVVCAGIHMSDIPSFPYRLLWGERQVRSVANLTRTDAREFFSAVRSVPLRVHAQPYALADANVALDDLRAGRVRGSAVLVMDQIV